MWSWISGCRAAATKLIRPWVWGRGRRRRREAGWDTLMHTSQQLHTSGRPLTPAFLQSLIAHIRTVTHSGSRCRLTQRSTWGVTLEKEGHWEMFLATCRASILRAASTSSSWAAHTGGQRWGGGGIEGQGSGLRPEDRRAKERHIDTSVHTYYWKHH